MEMKKLMSSKKNSKVFKIDLIVWKFAEFVECAIYDNSLK